MLVIDKGKASFLRKNLKKVCIYKTMRRGGSRRGTYYTEESSAVMRLLSKYDNGQRIIEEYPVSE